MAGTHRRVIIVADGDVDAALLGALVQPRDGEGLPPLVLAADGGAGKALAAGVRPDLVIGDGDSLRQETREALLAEGIEVRLVPVAKDESDTELCLVTARDAGAGRITLLGALGGMRPDHALANVLLLADPRFDDLEVEIMGQGTRMRRLGSAAGPGSRPIEGAIGDIVSLLPLGGPVHGVTTTGLRFPLRGETLLVGPARGLSNEIVALPAGVTTERGCLLVVHSIATSSPLVTRKENIHATPA